MGTYEECEHGEDARIDLGKLQLLLRCADCGGVTLELESCPEHLIEALQSFLAEEDAADADAVRAARAEPGDEIPWEQVKTGE